ncbi:PQQ-dependent sugar dehydrogenase [Novosphingobium sp. M1R2S20]|uniref:PQQ-dependent sugar dehydrogenase n=1 Tax=Novosphingobium rhizovicinum TaxID=3228928 RepID=A0ABV3R7H5_9SPHN
MIDTTGFGRLLASVSPLLIALASCGASSSGENARPPADSATSGAPFEVEELAQFDEPWAMDLDQSTGILLITERKGTMKLRLPDGRIGDVTGMPEVAYGGQGGLGDVIFAPGQSGGDTLDGRTVYLSWAEEGEGDTRGAAVGRGTLACPQPVFCELQSLDVIWRQVPKVTGKGHYSHRIAFSPDGKHLFVSSGDRQKMEPAQDLSNTLGTIVRLNPDGTPAAGNPFADRGAPTNQIWSYGHRNMLGLAFGPDGRLWTLEHGPAGGDEINLVKPGQNYGWPLVSEGNHYDGRPIPDNDTRPDLAAPAISWDPVIAPGNFIFYTGDAFPQWQGEALVGGMKPNVLVRVAFDGEQAREVARYPVEHRIRELGQAPDGSVWLLEDGKEAGAGRLLKLTPAKPR